MKSFEEKLEKLESLSEKIRESELPLEETISCFDEGVKLAEELENELKKAERKVEIILSDEKNSEKQEPELFDNLPQ